MGIPTLIKTLTASGSASLDFVDGTADVTFDSTYDEYMFVFTDIHPEEDDRNFMFQVNATDDAGGDYDTSLITSTSFEARDDEGNTVNTLQYVTADDLAQSASFQILQGNVGAGENDESTSGILHLFSPSSTTYVKHFYSRFVANTYNVTCVQQFVTGYINDTTAIDEIQFKFSSGNIDAGVIQMYGIA